MVIDRYETQTLPYLLLNYVLCCVLLITRLIYTQLSDAFPQSKPVIFGTFVLFAATFIKNILGSSFKRYIDTQRTITTKKMNLFYVLRVPHMVVFLLIFAAQVEAWRTGMFSIDISSINQIFFYSGSLFMISSIYTLVYDRTVVRKLRRIQKPEKFSFEDEHKE